MDSRESAKCTHGPQEQAIGPAQCRSAPAGRPPGHAGGFARPAALRLALPGLVAAAWVFLAGGALAAILFRTPIDISHHDVQPALYGIEYVESDIEAASDGTVYVVWEDDRDAPDVRNNLYYTTSSDNGQTWPGSSTAAYASSANLTDPSLAVFGAQVSMAWVQGGDQIAQKVLAPPSPATFTVPCTPTPGAVYVPDLEADSTGRLHIVFDGVVANLHHVYYSNNSGGSNNWLTATIIYTASGVPGASNPRLAVNPADDSLHVVLRDWYDSAGYRRSVQYISATNTGGTLQWHKPVTVTWGTGRMSSVEQPDIAVDSDDVLHVVWSRLYAQSEYNLNETYPVYAYSTNGGSSWTTRTIDSDSSKVYGVTRSDPQYPWPRIATLPLTGTDAVYLVWEGDRKDKGYWDEWDVLPVEAVWLATSSSRGLSWRLRQLSQAGSNLAAMRPVVATDPVSGTVHVAWDEQGADVGNPYRIYYVRGAPGSSGVYLPIIRR